MLPLSILLSTSFYTVSISTYSSYTNLVKNSYPSDPFSLHVRASARAWRSIHPEFVSGNSSRSLAAKTGTSSRGRTRIGSLYAPTIPTQAVAKWWHDAPGAPGYNRELPKYILDTIGRHRKPAIFTLPQLEAQQNKEAATRLVVSRWPLEGDGKNCMWWHCTREDMS